jgi:hypothetical protein
MLADRLYVESTRDRSIRLAIMSAKGGAEIEPSSPGSRRGATIARSMC